MSSAYLLALAAASLCIVSAQPPFPPPDFPRPPLGFPGSETIALVAQFDQDGDKRLNSAERAAARQSLTARQPQGRPNFPGPPNGFRRPAPKPGPKLTPASVRSYSREPFYDPAVLRTLFLQFENEDWEAELAAFKNTDVEVPATLTVDGQIYRDVGIRFRGSSSYMMAGDGYKRSLNVSIDFTHKDQRLLGYRSLNLLNANQDSTFLRAPLYLQIVRQHIPAPQANHVRVVINGESWGLYINLEQVNTDFIERAYSVSTKEAKAARRWKVSGIPFGGGGLNYIGDDPQPYRRLYEIKSKDDPDSWKALISLCRTLNETPLESLEATLRPVLDLDGVLKFLALENALINNDGYWTRASDFNLYQDTEGRFHIIPHDVNETLAVQEQMPGGFRAPFPGSGPGQGRPRPAPRTEPDLDPFAGSDDPRKPLLHRLLAVPALRSRYIAILRDLATRHLDWKQIEPAARQAHSLIASDVAKDTRKLESTAAFEQGLTVDALPETNAPGPFPMHSSISLKSFFEKRRAFLLSSEALHAADPPAAH